MAEGSDFALELVVGIKDMFTQQAKKIDAEVNKLEKDTTALQKTFDDTTAYKKAAAALEEMGRAGDTTAEQLQQQEKLVDDLAKSLKRAGVDINNITREEERLNRQMQETNNQLKKRSGWKDLITGGLSAVASHGMLKAFMDAGDKIAKIEILMRNQSNLSEEEIKGERGRQFRKNDVAIWFQCRRDRRNTDVVQPTESTQRAAKRGCNSRLTPSWQAAGKSGRPGRNQQGHDAIDRRWHIAGKGCIADLHHV